MSLAVGTPAALSRLSAATIYLLWLEAEGHRNCQVLGPLVVKAQGSKPPAGVFREMRFCFLKDLEQSHWLLGLPAQNSGLWKYRAQKALEKHLLSTQDSWVEQKGGASFGHTENVSPVYAFMHVFPMAAQDEAAYG